MGYSIEEYISTSNENNTYAEIVPNKSAETTLLYQHQSRGSKVVPIWELFQPNSKNSMILPKELFKSIKTKASEYDQPITIQGLSTYLSLINEVLSKDFFIELKNHLDKQDLNAAFIILSEYYDKTIFSNPKYEDSFQIAMINGEEERGETPSVEIYPEKYCIDYQAVTSFSELIKLIQTANDIDSYTLALNTEHINKTGLNKTIKIYDDPQAIFENLSGCKIECGEINLEEIFKECKRRSITLTEYIDSELELNDNSPAEIFKKISSETRNPLWPVFCHQIMKHIPSNTYLFAVIQQKPSPTSFLHCYVVDTAIKLIDNIDAKKYSRERSEALRLLPSGDYEALISEFVSITKNEPNAILWLNCNTVEEKCELISRTSKRNIVQKIPDEICNLFPELGYYYSDYDYGTDELTEYFRKYRYYKLTNTITAEFVEKAYNIAVPPEISEREKELAKYRTNEKNALLVIDGLGAEYMPLLVSLFSVMNYRINDCKIVSARLPSSTEFNEIKWNANRLQEIKGVDNAAHNGAIKNEQTTYEKNFYESIRVLKEEMLSRISKAINNYDNIIITADHGTSRLAIIAYENNFSRTLKWEGTPDDWRYSHAPNDMAPPNDYIRKRFIENNSIYWIVKGYNRLPKQGGKKYELHGGASLEECLVPFIVISSSWKKNNDSPSANTTKKPEQLKEKSLFAELD